MRPAAPDGLRQALAEVTSERLDAVAVPWSRTEEYWGHGDPEARKELSSLARHATGKDHRLYCWVCV